MTARLHLMFRITPHTNGDEIVLKLEGCLTAPVVGEVETCWRDTTRVRGRGPIQVDLRGICHVDREGRALMERLYREGARFVTKGCVMPEVVREIAQEAGGGRRM
jgi:hypothetical protein